MRYEKLITGELSTLELEIINQILNNEYVGVKKHEMAYPTMAYIVWLEGTEIVMGPVRWGHKNNYMHSDGNKESTLSASPFPGAWSMVPISKIVRVRHIHAI